MSLRRAIGLLGLVTLLWIVLGLWPAADRPAGPIAEVEAEPLGHELEPLAEALEVESWPAAELAEAEAIELEVRRILSRFGAPAPVPDELEAFVGEVYRQVDFYRVRQRGFFERAYVRQHKYWPTIQRVFSARGIPVELGHMALVESGFDPLARSPKGARGLWQFIPSTGKRYGLARAQDFHDVHKSTQAAAEYLLDLIGIFGSPSFLLATAAYNAGEARVQDCLRKLRDPFDQRSFWHIRRCLARETREYVPRVLAAAVISSDPGRFGFDLPSAEEMRERHDVVIVRHVTPLSRLATWAGVSVAELRAANTDLARAATETPGRNFPLYVPPGTAARLAAAPPAPEPPPSRPPPRRTAAAAPAEAPAERARAARVVVYTVRRGNTVEAVADLFSVTGPEVLAWNRLQPGPLEVGAQLLIYSPGPVRLEHYRVRRGDTVAEIAARFGVPARHLRTANGLSSGSVIRPGQRLLVYLG